MSSIVHFIGDCQVGTAGCKINLKLNVLIRKKCKSKLKNLGVIFTSYVPLCSYDTVQLLNNRYKLKNKISPKHLSSPFFKIKKFNTCYEEVIAKIC